MRKLSNVREMEQQGIVLMVGTDYTSDINLRNFSVYNKIDFQHPIDQVKFIKNLLNEIYDRDNNTVTNCFIVTNSPYVLNAIQTYSGHYGFADKIKYYDTYLELNDCTEDVEYIYKKLSKPLQELENFRWSE